MSQGSVGVNILNAPTGNVTSTLNSTTVPLGPFEEFVGEWEDVSAFQELTITGGDLPEGAPGTLCLEFSRDGATPLESTKLELDVGGPAFRPQFQRVVLPFMRVRFANGSVPQSSFILTTILHYSSSARISRHLDLEMNSQEPSEVVRAVLVGKAPDGVYRNVIVDESNRLYVRLADVNTPSLVNRTTDLLGPGGQFVGEWESTLAASGVLLQFITDAGSAPDGLSIQFSDNGVDILTSISATISPAGGIRTATHTVRGRYFRVVYTNGPVQQGVFRLGCLLQATSSGLTTQQLSTVFTESGIAPLVRAAMTAKDSVTENFYNVMARIVGGIYALCSDVVDRADRLLGIVTSPQLPTTLVGGRLAADSACAAASCSHLNANGTTVVKVAPGTLRRVVINAPGNTANSVTVLDGAIIIARIKSTVACTLEYDLAFATNLTVTLGGGQPADVTVTFD